MTTTSTQRQPVLGLPDPGERVPSVAWPTIALYVLTLGLFALEMYGALSAGWSPWVTIPMGTAVTFLMFSVLHESTHHAISTNTRLNDMLGHISVPFVTPYAPFRLVKFIHIEHHRNTNEHRSIDPDAWTSEGPWWQLPFRWMTIDVWYLVFYARRILDRPRGEVVVSVVTAVGVLGAFAALFVAGYGAELVVAFLIPQRLGLGVLAWWFDYLPHHGLPFTQRQDKYRATRVRVGGEWWLTPLFVYQNYHLVHHLHPSVPFYRYVRAWRRNEQAYLDRNAAISTVFGRSLTPSEYRTWRRLTDEVGQAPDRATAQRPIFHPLRVQSIEQLTADSKLVTFEVPDDLSHEYRYVQGQHITLRAMVDGQDVRRSYSIVAPVSAGTLRIAVKQVREWRLLDLHQHRARAGRHPRRDDADRALPHHCRSRCFARVRGCGRWLGNHAAHVDHCHDPRGGTQQHLHARLRQQDLGVHDVRAGARSDGRSPHGPPRVVPRDQHAERSRDTGPRSPTWWRTLSTPGSCADLNSSSTTWRPHSARAESAS